MVKQSPTNQPSFVYCVSSGRCGTAYLTALLRANFPAAQVFHERVGFPHFGVHSPDASHLTTFNHLGNHPMVQAFWKRKLMLDSQSGGSMFIETSHYLAKGGLIENLGFLPEEASVHVIFLSRDLFTVYLSFLNRFEFANRGFTWLYSLDSRYPNVIIPSQAYQTYQVYGQALWYLHEMQARSAYYRCLLRESPPQVCCHEVTYESISSARAAHALCCQLGFKGSSIHVPTQSHSPRETQLSPQQRASAEAVFRKIQCNPTQLGEQFYRLGHRLGAPRRLLGNRRTAA